MAGRDALWRGLAVALLVAGLLAAAAVALRGPSAVTAPRPVASGPASGDALERCRALGAHATEDPTCPAVWRQARDRFFGKSAP